PSGRSRFAIISPVLEDGIPVDGVRFGVENESARLNLNALLQYEMSRKIHVSQGDKPPPSSDKPAQKSARQILMNLPGMTENIADAILDWLDPDNQPREFGAESEYYSMLTQPYAPTNGPLTNIEELLLVRGVTPELLFGRDINRNRRIDFDEASYAIPQVDNSDGSMNQGWAAYLTLCSAEKNVQSNGRPRINLNQKKLQTLYDQLEQTLGSDQADFIVYYRQYGPYKGSDDEGDQQKAPEKKKGSRNQRRRNSDNKPDFKHESHYQFKSVLDLIGAKVRIEGDKNKQPEILDSPFSNSIGEMNSYLPSLMDCTTVNPAAVIPGRININQAPRIVLECIPGITPELVENIIAQRPLDPTTADLSWCNATWLLTSGLVDLAKMKALEPFITCSGDVYRLQTIGYFDDGPPVARIEAVIDNGTQPARVLFWKDISHLGPGFTSEELGVDTSY
ncbi:MAG: hypothetical protein ACWGMZ_06370, partial [Thermoguttaceae bacterium]